MLRENLQNKIIDSHSHIGVEIKMYCREEYPYSQSAESLYYRQLAGGVDVNVIFPFSVDLFCDMDRLKDGKRVPSLTPASEVPYQVENSLLMREIFDYCPELSEHFIPFISVDPAREVQGQVEKLEQLEKKYPIYGIKINPVGCQSKALELLNKGEAFMDFAEERDIPFIFHSTSIPGDEYSQAADIFKIVEMRHDLRFCFAHALHFNREFLKG